MSGPCNPDFDRLADTLGGFGCDTGQPVLQVRAPWELTNWTLPVIEAVMVLGAVYALVHAIRRWRREGDPTVIALWGASVIYLLVMEPPLYFPEKFGLEESVGIAFVHNVFSVEFLWDRLPLYIVALYPAMITLAYEIVRCLGVFHRRGLLVGAAATGFVHHCFYEVFDHLGPQLRWWIWNTDAKSHLPAIGSVPMTSVVLFAALQPFALVLLVRWFVGRRVDRGERLEGWGLAGRIAAAGALVPPLAIVVGLPASVFNGGDDPNHAAVAVTLAIYLVVMGAVTAVAVGEGWRRGRAGEWSSGASGPAYVTRHGGAYLLVLGLLWLSALPDFVDAVDGITSDGTPIGNPLYAAFAFAGAALSVGLVATARPRSSAPPRRHAVEEPVRIG